MMALKAVHVSDVPSLDHVPDVSIATSRVPTKAVEIGRWGSKPPAKFLVIGHRGNGMNLLSSPDPRVTAVKENSVVSFNDAGRFAVDFVEFDVQVTKDNCPIIFHDNFIITEENGNILERRVTDLYLEEFLCYGPQKETGKVGKSLLRKLKDGKILSWDVQNDSPVCTLEEAFQEVDSHLGFNIELKFDDNIIYQEEELTHVLQVILQVVFKNAGDRPIIFSSFQPDAIQLIRKLQNGYPVYFLTNGGTEIYTDVRRNSLDEAIKLCLSSGLQGIVSQSRAIFKNPTAIPKIKESNLILLTYGQLNNVSEAVYLQHLMGVNGVIVDLVEEITEAVSDFMNENGEGIEESRPKFSQRELAFLLKLIPELA
ncbi:uncharacterized protein A4U43_C02F11430 [Asparagus officinalis]|uniref:glycerophosphodiester phosphodiesterase n=1 Tax=Asparagus officinalis TaxID=4686 RepID=A0A5P1FIE7_ASPOF|nr:glycerophosphodiester phosphodiesterase GDPD1, chloroplastic-like [Asparagus officinalis]ONK77854.1 uncharacterized protein A4U43_C02F11430 [Asparagus officinalis]